MLNRYAQNRIREIGNCVTFEVIDSFIFHEAVRGGNFLGTRTRIPRADDTSAQACINFFQA